MASRITFLIGNGFDLNLNMQTQYDQFYKNCLLRHKPKKENEIVNEIIDVYKTESEQNKKLWSDLEIALGQYIPSDKVSDVDFIESSNEILLLLQGYLKGEQEKLLIHDEAIVIQQMYNAIAHFYDVGDNLNPQESEKIKAHIQKISNSLDYSVISFNYTVAFDKLFDLLKKSELELKHKVYNQEFPDSLGEVFHIHGVVDDGIILGVDNVDQIKNPNWKKNVDVHSSLIKTNANDSWGYNRTKTANRIIDESIIICAYGLSFGKTDQTWWKKLFYWLLADSSHLLVIALHKSPKQDRLQTVNERVLMNRNGRELFVKAANITNNDWNRVRNQVIICENPNWFDLDVLYLDDNDIDNS